MIIAAALLVIIAVGFWIYSSSKDKIVPLGDMYNLEYARTAERQQTGLSNRDSLPVSGGMVFPFGDEAERCFWMKDMRFSIDIIWVDGTKQITHIEHKVSPKTYPKTYCHTAQYVIELRSGEAMRHELRAGQKLDF